MITSPTRTCITYCRNIQLRRFFINTAHQRGCFLGRYLSNTMYLSKVQFAGYLRLRSWCDEAPSSIGSFAEIQQATRMYPRFPVLASPIPHNRVDELFQIHGTVLAIEYVLAVQFGRSGLSGKTNTAGTSMTYAHLDCPNFVSLIAQYSNTRTLTVAYLSSRCSFESAIHVLTVLTLRQILIVKERTVPIFNGRMVCFWSKRKGCQQYAWMSTGAITVLKQTVRANIIDNKPLLKTRNGTYSEIRSLY